MTADAERLEKARRLHSGGMVGGRYHYDGRPDPDNCPECFLMKLLDARDARIAELEQGRDRLIAALRTMIGHLERHFRAAPSDRSVADAIADIEKAYTLLDHQRAQ